MATKQSTNLQSANVISDRITRKLTQLKGTCALIGAADMRREIFDNDDLQGAMWAVQDLLEGVQSDYAEFYAVARKGMEVAHG
jgi:hypothetical protein